MDTYFTLSIRPARGGVRKFAVTTKKPIITSGWSSNRNIWSLSNQTWEASVWQRIEERGYVCRLIGGGRWSNRGIHGVYIGTAATAEAALLAAWPPNDDGFSWGSYAPPTTLIAPMRDHDAAVTPATVE